MNKIYTYKQIIFGLREQYIEIEKQLAELKKYVTVSSKVEDFYFHIAGNPSKLLLYLHKKKTLLEKIEILLNQYIYGTTNYNVTEGAKDSYYYRQHKICSITSQDELNKKIDEIVQSDFFKNIIANNHVSIPSNENKTDVLLITQSGIDIFTETTESYPHLSYSSDFDELVMTNREKNIIPDDIFKLLNLSINGSYLNDYHHRVLDDYEEKEIDIDDSFISTRARIEIIEEPKKLILKPKPIVRKI